jgi:GDP-4-dehydro-6-deoxy-D-mannose reductase
LTGIIVTGFLPFSRIMVTGADGFVGSYLLPLLRTRLAPGATITLASRKGAGDDSYAHVALELKEPESVAAAVDAVRPDLTIHLAAQASIGQSLAGTETWTINLGGSLALASAIAKYSPAGTFLHVSSAEVYGRSFGAGVATEDTALQPLSAYARSKAASEWMLRDILPETTQLIIARPSNHSGARQDERFVIPAFASQIAAIERDGGGEIYVGNLDAERDFLDVRDVVRAYVELIAHADELPARCVYNIGSGTPIRVGEILDRLLQMATIKAKVAQDSKRMRPSEVGRAAIDCSAIRDAVGWRPEYGLDEMLRNILVDRRQQIRSLQK